MAYLLSALRAVTASEIVHACEGSIEHSREMLLPDALGFRDFRTTDTDQLRSVMVRRIMESRFPVERVSLRWPKGFDRSKFRIVTEFDAIDQLIYRLAVSPAARHMAASLRDSVVAHRVEMTSSGWRVRRVATAGRERRRMVSAIWDDDYWLGTLDVKRYYPALADDVIARSLYSIGASDWATNLVLEARAMFDTLPGAEIGVPVGPEASAVPGTVGLHAVDNVLSRQDLVGWCRFVDDVWIVGRTSAQVVDLIEEVAEHLRVLGLAENRDKRRVVTGADAIDIINDPTIAYVAGNGLLTSPQQSLAFLERGAVDQRENLFGFGLGGLRRHSSTLGIEVLLANPSLMSVDPRATGLYLSAVAHLLGQSQVDRLIDFVTSPSVDHDLGGRTRVADAIAKRKLTDAQCDRLLFFAGSSRSRSERPLRRSCLAAASRGGHPARRVADAMDIASSTDDLDLRRVALVACKRADNSRSRLASNHLRRKCPELRPFRVG